MDVVYVPGEWASPNFRYSSVLTWNRRGSTGQAHRLSSIDGAQLLCPLASTQKTPNTTAATVHARSIRPSKALVSTSTRQHTPAKSKNGMKTAVFRRGWTAPPTEKYTSNPGNRNTDATADPPTR